MAILEVATGHLDAVNEMVVRRALTRLMTDRTTLVIARRLSTIRNADIIVTMENGRIVDQGTHDELASSEGLYSRLVRHQVTTVRAA